MVVAGKNTYLSLLALLCERGIDPAQSLHVTGVHPHAYPHTGFADPDVIGAEVALQRKILKDRIVGVHEAGEAVLPERDLMKRLRHLIKAVDDQIDLAALHVQKAHIRRIHDVERDTRGVFSELREHRREKCGLGIVAGHDAHHHLRLARRELGGGLHGAIHAQENLLDQRFQLQCAFGGGHALRGAHQQWVVKQGPQSSESVAHRGL